MTIGYYRDGKKQAAEARLDAEPIYTFGLAVRDLDDSHAKEMGLRSDFQAVVITKVDDDSPAARSENHRLYPGDVVYRIDTRFGSFSVKVSEAPGQITVKSHLAIKVSRVHPKEYAAWKKFCADADSALSPRLSVGP